MLIFIFYLVLFFNIESFGNVCALVVENEQIISVKPSAQGLKYVEAIHSASCSIKQSCRHEENSILSVLIYFRIKIPQYYLQKIKRGIKNELLKTLKKWKKIQSKKVKY